MDRAYLIKFFGLREGDVEWFRIEKIQKDLTGFPEHDKSRTAAALSG